MRPREGDFIETTERLIFDVKGSIHPPRRVVAYVRYVPDECGNREREGIRYRKVYSLKKRRKILRERWPIYIYNDRVFNREMQGVPLGKVKVHYFPIKKLRKLVDRGDLNNMERKALELCDLLRSATDLPWRYLGVSGSLLVGLQTISSDIDIIVYGIEAGRIGHEALKTLIGEAKDFKAYSQSDLHKLYMDRSMEGSIKFEDFARHEARKVLQGKFRGVDYFVRCVKDWSEVEERYGENVYYPMGRAMLQATIEDDKENILTPCRYRIKDVRVLKGRRKTPPVEIVSFRGRFCEQARRNEDIMAEGTLEKIVGKRGVIFRLVVGEHPSDYLMTLR